jgi:hypothetical protein
LLFVWKTFLKSLLIGLTVWNIFRFLTSLLSTLLFHFLGLFGSIDDFRLLNFLLLSGNLFGGRSRFVVFFGRSVVCRLIFVVRRLASVDDNVAEGNGFTSWRRSLWSWIVKILKVKFNFEISFFSKTKNFSKTFFPWQF